MSYEKYEIMINEERLSKAIEWFCAFVMSKDGLPYAAFHEGYMKKHECYKYEIFENAHRALHLDSWTEDMIGTHQILDYVIAGFSAGDNKNFNNVRDYRNIYNLQESSEKNVKLSEDILYRLLTTDDIANAFDDACEYYGRWYPAFTYLLFIRDRSRFLPVRPHNHPDRFQKLGISTDCLSYCSWNNYETFLGIHHVIQEKLRDCFPEQNITLLDAHSFVWTLHAATENLTTKEELTESQKEYTVKVRKTFSETHGKKKQLAAIEEEINSLPLAGKEKETLIKTRVNQGIFRKLLLRRYKICCLCNVSNEDLLIASHIKPWSACAPDERLNPDNGFLFCPNHDRLFDHGWISFADDGTILVANDLDNVDRTYTNIRPDMQIDLREGNKEFLHYHREHIFKGESR